MIRKKSSFNLDYDFNQTLINQTFLIDVFDQLLPVLVIIRHVRDPDVALLHQFIIAETVSARIVELFSRLGDVSFVESLPILLGEGLL